MLELEDALARILAAIPAPADETIPLSRAPGRILRRPSVAAVPLPAFDNSSVDGYAVRSADVGGAAAKSPVALRQAGRIAAGESPTGELAPGAAVRLFTGSPLPRGADAVVMQEETRIHPDKPGEILVLEPVKPWENVRFRGEDVKEGETLAEAGERLTAGRILLLGAAGTAEVVAGRRPRVGILATGSELKEPGERLGPGQIYECARAALAALVERTGGIPTSFPPVPDALDATCGALERAFSECDLVLTCGGVSVGDRDFVKSAFEKLGGTVEFWKVSMKPGKPFVFGRRANKFLFGLPGNPVSAMVTFLLLARPALFHWQGASAVSLPSLAGKLAEPLDNPGARRHFVRVNLDAAGNVRSAGFQASHMLRSFAAADGLVDVPPRTRLETGSNVAVLHWE